MTKLGADDFNTSTTLESNKSLGYIRVSKRDGSQVLDVQRDALTAAGVDTSRIEDPRAHLRQKLRFHRGSNRSSSSTGYVEENIRIFPSIRWEFTRLSDFLPHRFSCSARDTADVSPQNGLFIQALWQTVILCLNAHAGPGWARF